jgi:uncharacterized protein YjbI with pentapeptide repeats
MAALEAVKKNQQNSEPVTDLKFCRVAFDRLLFDDMHFIECQFDEVTFHESVLESITFIDCKFNKVSFDSAQLLNCSFVQSALTDCTAVVLLSEELSMVDCQLTRFDATRATLKMAHLVKVTCVDVIFLEANLEMSATVQTTHQHTNFSKANLQKAAFQGIDLTTCTLTDIQATKVVFSECTLDGLDLTGAVFTNMQCNKASLQGVIFNTCELTGANFTDAKMNGAQMRRSNLTLASWLRTELRDCCFDQASLVQARVIRSDASGSSLLDVDAKQSVWHLSTLRDVKMSGANLYQADLIGADLTRADLTQATLSFAKLDKTIQEDTRFSIGAKATIMPANDSYAEFILAAS